MKYSLIAGSLPFGITMSQVGSDLRLSGITQLDTELFDPPMIENPEFMGAVNEYEDANIALVIDMPEDRYLMGVNLVEGTLPWGLEFTGNAIVGVAAELLDANATYYTDAESPEWKSSPGLLATIGETEQVTIPLAYERGNSLSVIEGSLPWGLEVTANAISGTTSELVGIVDPYINTDGPIWQTQAGMMGVFDEEQVVNLSATARPRKEGDNVNIYLMRGFLPYGLELTPSSGSMTGVISGTIDELRSVISQYGPFNNPKINTSSLPSMEVGKAIQFQIDVTVYGAKTHGVSAEGLPWGVEISPSGFITGTPTEPGSYNVAITTQDSEYLSITKTFKVDIK